MIDSLKAINQSNGIRVFPEGSNPPPQAGFKRDENQPWIFHPILQECRYRKKTAYLSGPCACTKYKTECTLFNIEPNILKCMNCEEGEE